MKMRRKEEREKKKIVKTSERRTLLGGVWKTINFYPCSSSLKPTIAKSRALSRLACCRWWSTLSLATGTTQLATLLTLPKANSSPSCQDAAERNLIDFVVVVCVGFSQFFFLFAFTSSRHHRFPSFFFFPPPPKNDL